MAGGVQGMRLANTIDLVGLASFSSPAGDGSGQNGTGSGPDRASALRPKGAFGCNVATRRQGGKG